MTSVNLLGHVSQDTTLSLSHLKVVDMVVGLVKEVVRVIQIDQSEGFFQSVSNSATSCARLRPSPLDK